MNKNPLLGRATLVAGIVLHGPGGDAEEVQVPRQRGSDEEGHRYYPPRKIHAGSSMGRDKKTPTPDQKLFAAHHSAGLSKAEKNAAKQVEKAQQKVQKAAQPKPPKAHPEKPKAAPAPKQEAAHQPRLQAAQAAWLALPEEPRDRFRKALFAMDDVETGAFLDWLEQ